MASDPGLQFTRKGRGFASISNLVPATKVYNHQNVVTSRSEENDMNICNVNRPPSPLSEKTARMSPWNWQVRPNKPTPGFIAADNKDEFRLIYGVVNDCEYWQNSDLKTQEDALKTTQLVYSYQAGKMVPKLREPRQLYGFNSSDMGPQQLARWPAELQVIDERIKHISYVPEVPEPFYKQTGMEKMPMCRSALGEGRTVYHYEPIGTFFLRSRVGGNRGGCGQVGVTLESPEDKTLLFESRFESGNLAKAVQISTYEYELWLRNDLYTNKHTQWFYFQIKNARPNATYRFTIVNLMKPDSLYNHGMRPLMYSERNAEENGIGWIRAGTNIKYYRNNVKYSLGKSEKNYYSLTWTIQFPYNHDTAYFAHCYPYTYSDLQDYISDIAQDPIKSKICKQRVLCRSLAGNMVYALNITAPSKNGEENKQKKAVIITSRVHPGESNSSWMMKGFLDYLMGNSPDARLLRDTFIFKVVPMLNPDGVIVGNYRCSLAGRDLNRNYKSVLKESFPTIYHARLMIHKVLEEREVAVYCDLHGHSRKQNVFIYGCENRGNPTRRLRERIFPMMLSRNTPEKFVYDSCKFKIQKSKDGTGRIVMWNMGIMNSYTMEATFAGSTMGKRKGTHFHTGDLEAMGYHFCDTLLDYCDPDPTKLTNMVFQLEERLRLDILQHLKQREGAEISGDMDINLDEDFSSELESSDGGSDSSNSDGLPIHLQYMAERKLSKKKKLKTRKERDKHKCVFGERKSATTPAATQTSESASKDKHQAIKASKHPTPGRKSSDGRSSGGAPIFSQERADVREAKKAHIYLDTLTSAYLKNGLLPSENNRETKRAEAEVPLVQKLSISLDRKMQESAVARIMSLSNGQGQRLPENDQHDNAVSYQTISKPDAFHDARTTSLEPKKSKELLSASDHQQPESTETGGHRDFDDRPAVKQHPLPFDPSLERERHMEMRASSSHGRKSRADSAVPFNVGTSSSASQLPVSVSERLDGEVISADQPGPVHGEAEGPGVLNMVPNRKQLGGQTGSGRLSRHGGHPSLRGKAHTSQSSISNTPYVPTSLTEQQPHSHSAKPSSTTTPNDQNVPHHPPKPHSFNLSHQLSKSQMHAASSQRQVFQREDAMTYRRPSPMSASTQGAPRHLGQTRRSISQSNLQPNLGDHSNTNDIPRRATDISADPRANSKRENQPKNASSEINDAIRSIQQIKESLLDPASRTNISPTTGQFIDHFIRKTDKEISAITAGLQPSNIYQGFEDEDYSSDTSRHPTVAPVPQQYYPGRPPHQHQSSVGVLRDPSKMPTRTQELYHDTQHFQTNNSNSLTTSLKVLNTSSSNNHRQLPSRSEANDHLNKQPEVLEHFQPINREKQPVVPEHFQPINREKQPVVAEYFQPINRQKQPEVEHFQAINRQKQPEVPEHFQPIARQKSFHRYNPAVPQPLMEPRPTMQLSSVKRQGNKHLNDLRSVSMINMDNLLGDVQSASQKTLNKRKSQRNLLQATDDELMDDQEYEAGKPPQRLPSSHAPTKKQVSKPAKISLMMSQHQQEDQSTHSNHLQPLTRVIKAPTVRPLRRS